MYDPKLLFIYFFGGGTPKFIFIIHKSEQTNEQTNERTHEQTNEQTNERTNTRTNERTNSNIKRYEHTHTQYAALYI